MLDFKKQAPQTPVEKEIFDLVGKNFQLLGDLKYIVFDGIEASVRLELAKANRLGDTLFIKEDIVLSGVSALSGNKDDDITVKARFKEWVSTQGVTIGIYADDEEKKNAWVKAANFFTQFKALWIS